MRRHTPSNDGAGVRVVGGGRRSPRTRRRLAGVLLGVLVLGAVALAMLAWAGYREDTPAGAHTAIVDPAERVAYGAYLARVGDCLACHTAPGGRPYAGGTAIPTAFGTFYGPNITPDPATGIGSWTQDDFWRALHLGKRPDASLLYPAFPYTEYTRISRADADALYAYLRTVPAVHQASRPHELEFPYGWRPLVALWRGLYFEPGVHPDAAAKANAPVARGRYLVDGLGHCIACHAPRNALGATPSRSGFGGGSIEGLGWYAPPLGGDARSGLGRWSAEDIAALLRTGTNQHGAAAGPMAEVVTLSTQYLSDDDAHAIAAYLKTLPATPVATGAAAVPAAAMQRGEALYKQHCLQCHGAQGQGSGTAWPPLAGNISVTASHPDNLIKMVLEGGFAPATAANPRPHGMPPFGQVLNDDDVAAVVTFVRNSWGNSAGGATALQVKQARTGAQ